MNQLIYIAPAMLFWFIATTAKTDRVAIELLAFAIICAIFGGAKIIRDLFIGESEQ